MVVLVPTSKMFTTSLVLFATIISALSSPLNLASRSLESRELTDTLSTVTIHDSCNSTERRQLTKALADTYEVASVARDYVLNHGVNDAVYQTYFGNADPFSVIGAYENLISGNKDGILLRCDDIDQNCHQEGWAGHWRGENATLETVICPLSYELRGYNEQWCTRGYNVAEFSASYYFATDLIHRFFHVPTISNNLVGHYADEYADCIELAEHNATWAPFNTHTLQYFAADVYGREVAAPGVGCSGEIPEHVHEESEIPSSSAAPETSSVGSAISASSAVVATSASLTTAAESSCHTHADGEVHC